MKKKTLDDIVTDYADSIVRGEKKEARKEGRQTSASSVEPGRHYREEGKMLMDTIEKLHSALRPLKVPEALATRVRERVRHEIAAADAPLPQRKPARIAAGWGAAAKAFLRRAGELVVNIDLGQVFGGQGVFQPRPAEVYAYSVVEALDKAAQRKKARILVDTLGRIYEVPQSLLKRYALSKGRMKRGHE